MSKNPWAYRVTPAQWRRQEIEQSQIVAQIEACTAAGIEPLGSDGSDPYLLAACDHGMARRMGVDGADLAALCFYVEIERPWHASLADPGPRWYATGKALAEQLEARFGHVWPSSQRPKRLADARRRLRRARTALQ